MRSIQGRLANTLVSVGMWVSLLASLGSACAGSQTVRTDLDKGSPAGQPAAGQEKPSADKIKVAQSAISATMSLPFIAQEEGIFAKNGLEVEIVYTQGSSAAVAGMLSGDLQFGAVGGDAVVNSTLEGGDLVLILGFQNRMDYKLFTRADIRSPADLQGGKLGITRFGTVPDFVTRLALRRLGLEPDRDVTIVQVGSIPERAAAMESGAIEGTVMTSAFSITARKRGFYEMLSLEDVEFQQTSLAARKSYLRDNQAIAHKMVKSMVDTVHFFKTQKEAAIRRLSQFLRTEDREQLEDVQTRQSKMTQDAPYPTIAGLKLIIDHDAQWDPRAASLTPKDLVDTSVLKEMEKSGYIRQLYGR